MKVPFFDLKRQYEQIGNEIREAINRVIKRQFFILGEELELFEKEFLKYLGVKYCVGVNSGTDGLLLALKALDISRGDEIITPTYSFIATSLAISWLEATPVFVDSDPDTFNINTDQIEEKITKRTKAILTVHICGLPSNMEKIMQVANKHNLKIIEDACQAHGSEYKGEKAGTLGDIGVFSFYPSKNLGAYGDAGAVCTNDDQIFIKLKLLRNYGQIKKYYHVQEGINSRLDEIQASVLRVKLKYLDDWNTKRNAVAATYKQGLLGRYKYQEVEKDVMSNYYLFVILSERRNDLINFLKKYGISILIHYPVPIHLQDAYSNLNYKKGDFPVAEEICNKCLSLPMYPELKSVETEHVIEVLNSF
jgi:dTDP-4-amino-4,6-dideoxygalactose transaminase